MNREIKFRVWNKDTHNWHNILTLAGKNPMNPANGIDAWLKPGVNLGNYANNENYVITQSTGLKDKDKREIYEGDIIKVPENPIFEMSNLPTYSCGVVTWIREGFEICQKMVGATRLSQYVMCDCCPVKIEVIGNIFENPELLK